MTRFEYDPRVERKQRAKPVQREHGEQQALFYWMQLNRAAHPALDMAFAIPNGGHRNPLVAAKLKREGVKAGVLDIFIPWPQAGSSWPNKPGAHGLFIELKAEGGRVSDAQIIYIEFLQSAGYRAEVCYGWQSAARVIIEYLGLNISV